MATAPALPAPGTRVRAGNAMARTRAAVLEGAARSIAEYGSRRTTMADIASLGGIAKATLYNHFRRKADVYAALAEAEVRRIAADCAALAPADLTGALTLAAEEVACHPVVRRLALDEPEVVAVMAAVVHGAPEDGGSALAASLLAELLVVAGRQPTPEQVDAVLRWISSHLAAPGTADSRAAGAALLAGALAGPVTPARSSAR